LYCVYGDFDKSNFNSYYGVSVAILKTMILDNGYGMTIVILKAVYSAFICFSMVVLWNCREAFSTSFSNVLWVFARQSINVRCHKLPSIKMKIARVLPKQNRLVDFAINSYRTLNGFTKDSSPPDKLFTGNDDWFNNYWLQNSTLIRIIIISPRKRPRLRKGKFPSRSATSYSAMEFCNAVPSWISSAGLRIRFPCL
ncbi:hypothetical protein T11_18268, partial [Trichinella zimbabwensis]